MHLSGRTTWIRVFAVLAIVVGAVLGFAMPAAAALTGTLNVPGDYATLDAAITDLNLQGVAPGGVTLNVLAGNPQTAPAGGYVVGGTGSLVLTSTGAANPVVIQGNGNVITAFTPQTAGALNDALFKLVGADWVTITGFTLQENPANATTAAATNNMTEWGVALLYVSTSDGAQNNTIQGNTISLNRAYTNTWGVYSNVRHSATAVTTTADIVNGTTAPNSFNKVYGNAISNVNMGIAFIGCGSAGNAAFQDSGNDIGGSSAATGNTLTNWGGAAAASSYVSNSGTSYGIFMNHQVGDNVSWNSLTSAAVSGTSVTFRGIFKDYTALAPTGTFTSSITNNTVTLSSGFTSGTFEAIRSQGMTVLATATVNINANNVLNCAITGAASASTMIGIVNSSVPGTLSMSNNVVRGGTSSATTGGFTGVSNTGAVVNTINLNGNQIGNSTSGAITFSAATSGAVLGVSNTGGAATAALSLSNNNVQGIVHSVNGTSAHTYLNNTATTLSQAINGNTFTNLSVATSGSVSFVVNAPSLSATGTMSISNNAIVTAFAKTVAGGTVAFHTTNASSVTGSTVTMTGNTLSNVTLTGATGFTGINNTDGASASSGPVKNISNNTISNVSGGTGTMNPMTVNFSGPNSTVGSNTIGGLSWGAAVTALSLGSSNQATLTVSGNVIGPVATTAGAVTGLTNAAPTALITQNTVSGLSSSAAVAVTGLANTAGTAVTLQRNKVYDLSGSNATSTVNGLLISGGTAVTAANNLIGDLRAPSASAADVIRGISVTSTTASTAINLYFNSVYLNATSVGANFGTSGIFHTTSATATTAALTMRNNVVVNRSTANGTGFTAAYRRSSTTLTNYASASNNNLLYAGTPAANQLLFYDGTNADQTMVAFQARVTPREAASVSENAPFLSTSGANANFLHIDTTVPTQIEGGAAPIAGITADFDGDARNVSTPDIGGDEGPFTLADLVGPSITYAPLGNTSSVAARSFASVAITDPSSVNGSPGTRPRVYYKKGTDANTFVDNTSATSGWKFVEANGATSPFDFTIDYSLLSGGAVTVGDVVQYFVVAQDLAGTPNVSIRAGTFAAQPASVNLGVAQFPIGGTINAYTIVDLPLNGDYTVGTTLFNQVTGANLTFERRVQKVVRQVLEPVAATPQMSGDKSSTDVHLDTQLEWRTVEREVEEVTWVPMSNGREYKGELYAKRADRPDLPKSVQAGVYATITAAVADLNARGVSGPVRFLLTDATYPSETFPVTVNVSSADVPTATNTVTIKPNTGVTSAVSGASASGPLFKVFNTNYVTIDGSNAVAGTTRDLTLENTSTTSPNVVWFGSSGTTPITNVALKNCVVRNGATTSSAVVVSDGATAGNAGYFSNVEIRNNRIEKAFIGVYSNGGTTPANGANLTYAGNDLSAAAPNAIRLVGLYMQGVNGATVSNNTIGNFDAVDGENDIGIWLATGSTNATVSGNTVTNLGYTGTSSFAPIGIDITPGVASANVNVAQNTVTNITSGGSTAVRGIASPISTTADVVIQRNNVQGITNTNTGTYGAYGIDVTAGNNHTVKNNFVSDVRHNMTGGAAFSTSFGVFGIRIGSGAGHVIDDNSVNLYGALSGTATSSLLSAALAVVGTTSTGCDIRNNILSNTITGGTTSIAHVSAYLPSGGTSAMNLTWNNNGCYSGASASTQGLAQVGTTAGTGFYLASAFVPGLTTPATNFRAYTSTLSAAGTNDNASFATTAAAPFVSSTDLHVRTDIATALSNAGAAVAGITDDFDGDARTATPDIGADEGNFIPLIANDVAARSLDDPANGGTKITGVAFTPTASFENDGTDPQTNVPVRYRIVDAGSVEVYNQTSTIASLAASAIAQVTFPSVTLSSAGTYTMFARAELPGDAIPSNDQITGTFSVLAPLAGTYAVGTGQPAPFDRLSTAVASLNQVGVSAAVTFELTDPTYSAGETFPITINAYPGGSATNSFTLKPATGATPAVTGSSATAVLMLNGADWVTIDGSNNGSSSRDLTITNTNTGTSSAVIWAMPAGGTDGASSDVIRNVNVVGSGNTQTLVGIGFGGATIGVTSNGADHDGNTIRNCRVTSSQYGIYSAGASAANKNAGTQIVGNSINAVSPNNVTVGGILVRFEDGVQITGNTVGEVTRASGTNFGISLGVSAATNMLNVTTGDEVTNATVSRNTVAAISSPSTTGYSAMGLAVAPATTGTNVLVNNMISGVTSPATPSDATMGVLVMGGTGGTTRLWFNSVSMTGSRGAATNPGFAVALRGSDHVVELSGNALANTQTSTSTGKSYVVGLDYSTYTNLTSDRNDLWASGASTAVGTTGGLTAGTDRIALADWQTATGTDAASISADPLFAATNDLHVLGSGPVSPLSNAALPVAGVTVDFDGQTRSGTPDIGADEFQTYALAVTAVNGSVVAAPAGPAYYAGTAVLLTATADAGYHFVNWTGDASGTLDTVTVVMSADRNVTANFALNSYTITASAGAGGSISPTGAVAVAQGADQTFTITPNAGYAVADVVVDAVSQGAVGTYTFTNVQADHAISASFVSISALSVNDVTAAEGNAGTTAFTFTVRLAPANSDTVRVTVNTADGTASAPLDYTAIAGQVLTFAPGDTAATVTVLVNGDITPEVDEAFSVLLSAAVGANIADGTGLGTITNDDVVTGVLPGGVPTQPYFAPAYPNPFQSNSSLEFGLSREAPLSLRVYDLSGRQVRVLRDGVGAPGRYRVTWNGTDESGRKLPSGLYLIRMETTGMKVTRRVTLVH